MATGDIALNILITAQNQASSVIQGLGSSLGPIGIGMAAIGVAATGAGIAAVKMAGDFQSGITTLSTGAGEAQSNLAMVSQGILTLSTSTGTTVQQLTSGMYMIESAGFHGAAGLQVLQAAAEGAKVGNADLGTVANATTTIMTDFGISSQNSSVAVNTLIATVANGKTTMGDLSAALSQVAPTAAAAGISLTDMMGAMATMTGEGVPAANAATFLRQTIIALDAPSKQTVSALQAVGLSSTDVANEMKVSLPGALQMITDAVGKKFPVGSAAYVNALKDIAGGSKQMQGILDLTGIHLATFKQNVDNISLAVQKGGGSILGWTAVQGDFNTQMDRAKASVAALFIVVGTQLLPVLTPIVSQIANVVAGFTQWMTSGGQLPPMLQNITGMFGVMGANWGQFIAQLQSSLGGPLTQFGQLMGSLLPGFISQFLRAINDVQLAFLTVASGASTLVGPALKILGQIFQGLQGVIEIILNALEGQFLPALQNLVSAIAPVAQAILQWIADSGIIPIVFAAIGVAVQIVIGVISFLINVLAAIITFFSQTAVGAALFKAILIVLAVVIGAIGIVILAVVIPAFIAWVAGAIAVGIANIIAFAPIILIILAIVAVIAVVILIIQNWGAIVGWLGGVWNAFASWFMGILGAIGAFFQNVWNGIAAFFVSRWNVAVIEFQVMLLRVQAFFQGVWNGIVSFFQGIWNSIINMVQTAIQTVVNWFLWLYNHNYYFKDLVDFIVNVITGLVSWLTNTWTTIVNWIVEQWTLLKIRAEIYWALLVATIQQKVQQAQQVISSVWNAIVAFLQGVWNTITSATQSAWNAISSFLQGIWNAISGFFQGVWNAMLSFLQGVWNSMVSSTQSAWNAISGVFGSAWNTYIAGPLGGLWNSISGWFGNLASTAVQWGANLIQGFINGILSMLGNVGNAIGSILGKIGGLLGFHSPTKEGEGQHIIEWGQNMVKGFGEGIEAATPMLHAQIEHLIQPPKLSYAKAAGSAFALSTSPVVHVHIEPGEAHVHLDKQKVGHAVMNFAAKEIRQQSGYRGR